MFSNMFSSDPIAHVKVLPGRRVVLNCPECFDGTSLMGTASLSSVDEIEEVREEQASLAEEEGDDLKRLRPSSNECYSCGTSLD